MKLRILLIAFLIFAFSGAGAAMAQGGMDMNGKDKNMDMSGMDMNGKDKNMDMSGKDKNADMSGMDMNGKDKNMDMSSKDKNTDMSGSNTMNSMPGMDMGEGPIKETPPNMKVLGTYGAVNLAFIIIGVWNKWFRRKDDLHGNTK